jgi:hypothetical protein
VTVSVSRPAKTSGITKTLRLTTIASPAHPHRHSVRQFSGSTEAKQHVETV